MKNIFTVLSQIDNLKELTELLEKFDRARCHLTFSLSHRSTLAKFPEGVRILETLDAIDTDEFKRDIYQSECNIRTELAILKKELKAIEKQLKTSKV
jgi:hypothetical protein